MALDMRRVGWLTWRILYGIACLIAAIVILFLPGWGSLLVMAVLIPWFQNVAGFYAGWLGIAAGIGFLVGTYAVYQRLSA